MNTLEQIMKSKNTPTTTTGSGTENVTESKQQHKVCHKCNVLYSCSIHATTRVHCDDCQKETRKEWKDEWNKKELRVKAAGRVDGDYIYC